MGFVYKLTHKKSRKAYIGQTLRPIHERLKEHQYANSGCRAISRAIKKHGWENFDKEWYEVPDEELNFYEEMLVALLGTLAPGGYNLMEGGGSKGRPSEETKEKMSEAHTGKTLTDEHKQKLSEALTGENNYNHGKTCENHHNYGKKHADESKQKMSEAKSGEKNHMYGKTLSDETKQKMSEAMSGVKNHASKKVYQYTIDGTYVDEFGSFGEAARSLNKSYGGSYIGLCAKGKRKDAYGFKWSQELL
ncbi:GIY-YIG catalytic domain-containing endonuclease [Paramecium bursaria Chlorella virus NW665.2]|nr:GIY-YIG catalytic domain-containing endonuclease [Paramecium bursaria Chlorella virus NW665.2]